MFNQFIKQNKRNESGLHTQIHCKDLYLQLQQVCSNEEGFQDKQIIMQRIMNE